MRKGYIEEEAKKIDIKAVKKSNKKDIIKFFIWMTIFIFVYYQIYVLVAYTLGKKEKENMWLYNSINKIMTVLVPKPTETIEENTLKLAALGDIYTSANIIKGAKSDSVYNFSDSLGQTKDLLSKYDVVLASLNTPVAGSSSGYSTKTVYNAPNDLLETIKSIGISVLATAGNHLMDKGENGIKSTINLIKTSEINQVGLNLSDDRTKPYIIDKNNIKVAVLSYMTTSKIKVTKGKEYLINTLVEENIKEDMIYVKSQNVDYTICYLNIPNEDSSRVNSNQKNSVDMLFQNGVSVVLGTGSKIVQEKSEDLFELSDGTKNHVYALYSLGDFLGDMDTDDRKVSIAADITFTKNITKDKDGNEIVDKTKKNMLINNQLSFYTKVSTKYKTINYPIDITLDAYNQDNLELDAKDYKAIKLAQDNLKETLK
ncbi:MAG: CapA family protein [Clostridia bacterium]|nr:CapA family protein [Clostridia bacterium]MDD4387180.1 CapA family protein [Clostridia bacterium]